MDQQYIQNLRRDYQASALSIEDVEPNPVTQFEKWFAEAGAAGVFEPNAMTLATTGSNGRPSARIVLLKGVDKRGFVFYTNYDSRKGRELNENAFAALVFFWHEMERQVRVEGQIKKVTAEESTAYFQSRPRGSQLGAAASPQSTVIPGRRELEERLSELDKKYAQKEIDRPGNWGGYVLVPDRIEFWQGRTNRLHDRLEYSLGSGHWSINRLAP